MSTSSDSQPHFMLSEFAQADKTLTISDINDLVMPRLLNIPEDVSSGSSCSRMTLRRLQKFKVDLEHIKDHLSRLKVLEGHTNKHIKDLLWQILNAPATSAVFTDDSSYWQLEDILTRLKIHMSATNYASLSTSLNDHKLRAHEPEDGPRKFVTDPPGMDPFFESPAAFRQFAHSYELLDPLLKSCLLCFSAFPENAEINKRTVIYWWFGEQLIDPHEGDNCEKNGHEIIKSLVEHGFLEDVNTKGRVTSRCRVRPFIQSVLNHLAKAASFFNYLDVKEYKYDNNQRRICLVKEQKGFPTFVSSLTHLRRSQTTDLERVETVFNVNKCYLNIKLHWFWKMKSIKVLYLGRCNSKAIQHIEVKSCKFLGGLKYMKGLRFLSLQGVSKIVKLPDSVGSVRNLRILDLRDCNDMEELPEAVKLLEKLTHLDMSGCYSLARLPKGIACLSELQILKGFLIREQQQIKSCSFQDLKKLKKLRKLTITTGLRSFPDKEHLEVFGEMRELRKLTIAWRGLYRAETAHKSRNQLSDMNFLTGLEKLDLQHNPFRSPPAWLLPDKLLNLNKLYVKGGKFLEDLGEKQHPGGLGSWGRVETLRLLHLPKLDLTWSQLRHILFPNLKYLERVECAKLTSIPCNGDGVWQKLPTNSIHPNSNISF